MEVENYSFETEKIASESSSVIEVIQNFIHEKTDGLNLFEKVMVALYGMMTLFFMILAIVFVFTHGFKY